MFHLGSSGAASTDASTGTTAAAAAGEVMGSGEHTRRMGKVDAGASAGGKAAASRFFAPPALQRSSSQELLHVWAGEPSSTTSQLASNTAATAALYSPPCTCGSRRGNKDALIATLPVEFAQELLAVRVCPQFLRCCSVDEALQVMGGRVLPSTIPPMLLAALLLLCVVPSMLLSCF